MKSIRIFLTMALLISLSATSFSQVKKEKIAVNGNCGMCKGKIEKAAKEAGASYAFWDADSKELTVEYQSTTSNNAKIQKAVAATGYDTQDVKATDAAYKKLHGCCQYDRAAMKNHAKECCKDGKCEKCSAAMDCCKDGKCTKEGHNGKDCCKKS